MSKDEKICPDCAETVKAAARICRFCGNEFQTFSTKETDLEMITDTTAEAESDQTDFIGVADKHKGSIMVALLLGLGLFGAFIISNASDTASTSTTYTDDDAALAATAYADAAVAAASAVKAGQTSKSVESPLSRWTYDTSRDEVRNAEIKTANLLSDNQIQLSAPYDGGTKAQILIRRHPEYGVDVMIKASPSQIICDSYDGCSIDINIDGKTQKLRMLKPADYDSELLFVSNGPSLVRKLKVSKKVVLELPFYSNGNGQFQFTTLGLEWDQK
jgi:RNA polymerase subunit RPABC4/transcription elongation factor Spt4